MKRYLKEIIILFLQLLMFYVFPLSMDLFYGLGVVLMIVMTTLLLSFLLGILSTEKIKYLYPPAAAVLFLPSVFIYYNESALVHALWYLVLSAIGLSAGSFLGWLLRPKNSKRQGESQ